METNTMGLSMCSFRISIFSRSTLTCILYLCLSSIYLLVLFNPSLSCTLNCALFDLCSWLLMASYSKSSLKALFVFQHIYSSEAIRSLHLYRLESGEIQKTERAYQFPINGDYKEVKADDFFRIQGNQVSKMAVGKIFAAWFCIYAFDVDHPPHWLQIPPHFTCCFKLQSIPTLEKDLQMTFGLHAWMTKEKHERILHQKGAEGREDPLLSSESIIVTDSHVGNLDQSLNEQIISKAQCSLHDATNESAQDPNSQPIVSQGIMIDLNIPIADSDGAEGKEKKQRKKRAAKEYLDSLTREDLAKYFHLNREQAAEALNIGMTALHRKQLELGIKRWPYYKFKVLDSLSLNIQDEAEIRQHKDMPAAKYLEEWQEQLNREKEKMEKSPSSKFDQETIRLKRLIRKRHKTVARNQAQGA